MELTVVNISGKVRTAKFDGRDFLVVPMTMMVPGVLNGSRGPLLYPEDEAAKSATAWNWIPIVVNHPMTGSARTPDYMSTNGVGHLTNCEFKDGKLKAEGWFDIAKTDKVDNRLIPLMRAGKKVELSTGLGVDLETAEGVHNDRTYVAVARSYRPDHLAILPDDVGACSLQDGCGINNAKSGGVWRTIRGAKVFIRDGVITKGPKSLRGKSAGDVDTDEQLGMKPKKKPLTEKQKAAAARKKKKRNFKPPIPRLTDEEYKAKQEEYEKRKADKSLPPWERYQKPGYQKINPDRMFGTHTYQHSSASGWYVYDHETRRVVADGLGSKENAIKVAQEKGGTTVTAKEAWKNKSKSVKNAKGVWRTIRGAKVFIEDGKITKGPAALRGKSEDAARYGGDKPDDKEHVAKVKGAKERFKKAMAKKNTGGDHKEILKKHKLEETPIGDDQVTIYDKEGHTKSAIVADLKKNGYKKANKGDINEFKTSEGFGADEYTDIYSKGDYIIGVSQLDAADVDVDMTSVAVYKKKKKKSKEDTNNQSFPLNHMEIPMCKQSLIDQLVENSDGLWSELDREHLDAFPEERLEQLVDNMCGDASHDDTDEEDEPAKGKAKMTNNKEVTVVPQPRQPITLDDLPAEFRAVYNHGLQAMNREKDNLIDKLVANISDEDAKKAKIETLSKKTMCELKEIASLLPVSNSQQEDHFWKEPEYNYQGAAVGNVRNEAYKPEPLGLPEMDFTA